MSIDSVSIDYVDAKMVEQTRGCLSNAPQAACNALYYVYMGSLTANDAIVDGQRVCCVDYVI